MTYLQAIILGIVQGLTEFLPVSSSGHLVLTSFFLNWQFQERELFILNVWVHIGTLTAIIVYFWRDLSTIIADFFRQLIQGTPFATTDARTGWLLIAATIPAGLVGLFFADLVEQTFSSPLVVGIALLVTATLMILGEKINLNLGDKHDITVLDAIFIGIMQSLALFPGISRSGTTISGGMMRHLRRESAGRFAFLMSVPIMVAAGSLSTYRMVTEVQNLGSFLPIMAIGLLTSMVVGYTTIRWFLKFLVHHSLIYFSIYCYLMGTTTILVGLLN